MRSDLKLEVVRLEENLRRAKTEIYKLEQRQRDLIEDNRIKDCQMKTLKYQIAELERSQRYSRSYR